MSRIVRHEFMGSWFLVCAASFTVVLIPWAIIYMINSTLRIETELDDAEAFVEAYRAGRLSRTT